jgi:asparagine synthase (glutamine-hydrolysing)
MCGIAGIVGPGADLECAQAMVRSLAHRGPDGAGVHTDGLSFLGHARLGIIDLEGGGQPMASADRAVWIAHNGEIYNFRELRRELENNGHQFRTRSDTEVILEGYRAWGVGVLSRLDGMFACALWDGPRRRLVLARDVFGMKPLHYHFDGATLRFASEIKAILRDSRVAREVDFQSLHFLLNLRYVPGARTLFAGIERLEPGWMLVFEDGRLRKVRFAELEVEEEPRRDESYYLEGIRHHLRRAVRRHLVADVPLGVFLSGGLDSSAIVAYTSEVSEQPLWTFSLGFGEPTDELADARVVAERFGTRHLETTLDLEPLRQFPAVIWATEEPKGNILQGFLLARFARQHVKAVLSGLGGDELFAGYVFHHFLYSSDRLHRATPGWLNRSVLAPGSRALYRLSAASGTTSLDEYRRGLQMLLTAGDPCLQYLIVRNAWDHDRGAFRLYGPAWRGRPMAPVRTVFEPFFALRDLPVLERALRAEMRTKLVDDLLLNEDRTAMASGLEVRVPFLDRELVRFAMSIPIDLRMRGNRAKYLFRKAMQPLLPAHTLKKSKQGFAFDPVAEFRKDLRAVANRVLTQRRVEERGWFDYAWLRSVLDHPPHPRLRWHYFVLWLTLGLEIWARQFLEGDIAHPSLDLEAYL